MAVFRVALLLTVLFCCLPHPMLSAAPEPSADTPQSAGDREANRVGDRAEAFMVGLALAVLVVGGSLAYALSSKRGAGNRDADEVVRQATGESRVVIPDSRQR